jgi:Zn-finger nucleic acid-binding protein
MRIDRDRGLLVCDYCRSQQDAPAALDYVELLSETSSLCPICSTPLSRSRLDDHPLLCCARCFGMLIDMNRFEAVIDAVRLHEERPGRPVPSRRQQPADRTIDCPSCGQTMLAHLYGGPGNVVVDSCERCHVNWLDGGELHRIAVAPDWSPRRGQAIEFDIADRTDEAKDDN